ncbi:MAG: hypothetical protein ACI9JN_000835 [Bacteroidia bacterium]|jgi:hypothetical protein
MTHIRTITTLFELLTIYSCSKDPIIAYHIAPATKTKYYDSEIFSHKLGMRKATVIPHDQATQIETTNVNRQVILSVTWSGGKYEFIKSMFATKEKFEEFETIVAGSAEPFPKGL